MLNINFFGNYALLDKLFFLQIFILYHIFWVPISKSAYLLQCFEGHCIQVYMRPQHLDNVSVRKCSQQRLRKGHFDRRELENDRNVRRQFLLKCQYFTISIQAGHQDKTFILFLPFCQILAFSTRQIIKSNLFYCIFCLGGVELYLFHFSLQIPINVQMSIAQVHQSHSYLFKYFITFPGSDKHLKLNKIGYVSCSNLNCPNNNILEITHIHMRHTCTYKYEAIYIWAW